MSIFFSTHCYSLGWQMGIDEAGAEFRRQCEAPDNDSLPCVRTLQRLRHIDECGAWCDTGSTRLGHSRSQAFDAALNSGCDYWVTCDDDCEADLATLRSMVEAVSSGPNACIAPFWARAPVPRVDVTLSPCGSSRTLPNGAKLLRATAAGLGLTVLSRAALHLIAEANQGLVYQDAGGVRRLAVFIEAIRPWDLAWMGEDLAFWSRVPPTVLIEVIATGTTVHAGRILDLEMVAEAASQKPSQNRGLEMPQNKP
jgi:hypothetical protein